MSIDTPSLDAAGLLRFHQLRDGAIDAVTERFYNTHGVIYAQFGQRGREACREDLAFHLEFLRPVLEFGLVQPMVDYLHWLANVLDTRGVPAGHLAQSLDWLADYFGSALQAPDGEVIVAALRQVKARFLGPADATAQLDGLMPDPWPETDELESALLRGDSRRAISILENCFGRSGLVDAEMHLIQPALYGIGRKWQNNQVTVAQEHLATAISQSIMTLGLARAEVPAPIGRRVVLACVEGNNHAVGLQMVADAFRLAGWDVHYLGAGMPTRDLLKHVDECKPDLLGLSISFAHQLRVVKDLASRLLDAQGLRRVPIIVGGLAINQFPPLAARLGVDSWSFDAGSAVAAAEKVVAHPQVT